VPFPGDGLPRIRDVEPLWLTVPCKDWGYPLVAEAISVSVGLLHLVLAEHW
jgi:hypothetical protein